MLVYGEWNRVQIGLNRSTGTQNFKTHRMSDQLYQRQILSIDLKSRAWKLLRNSMINVVQRLTLAL